MMNVASGKGVASPSVGASELSAHVHKSVCVAGVVCESADATRVRLQDHERATVDVRRAGDAAVPLTPGMKVLVRGTVNPDLSVVEDPQFPTTDLGEKFDLALHYDAAKTLGQSALSHMFS